MRRWWKGRVQCFFRFKEISPSQARDEWFGLGCHMGRLERERKSGIRCEGSRKAEVDLRAPQDVLDTSVAVTCVGLGSKPTRRGLLRFAELGELIPSRADWASTESSRLLCCLVNHTPSQKERGPGTSRSGGEGLWRRRWRAGSFEVETKVKVVRGSDWFFKRQW